MAHMTGVEMRSGGVSHGAVTVPVRGAWKFLCEAQILMYRILELYITFGKKHLFFHIPIFYRSNIHEDFSLPDIPFFSHVINMSYSYDQL
jgi:hypothetical protein